MTIETRILTISLLLSMTIFLVPAVLSQSQPLIQQDVLTPSEKKRTAAIENDVAKHLQALQRQSHERVMGRVGVSERNTRLACTLSWKGSLEEREGTVVGVVSFVSSDPQSDPALLKLVSFRGRNTKEEYSFQNFDVAAWPDRKGSKTGSFAVRVEMRQGLYYDWVTHTSRTTPWAKTGGNV